MLAGLLALRVHFGYGTDNTHHPFTAGSLSGLQRLTRLGLVGMPSNKPDALQPLSVLTGLLDLRLHISDSNWRRWDDGYPSVASMSGLQRLTRLEMSSMPCIEPGALAGKTLLQHLRLTDCCEEQSQEQDAHLLSQLQHLQQLTELVMSTRRYHIQETPPAAAFAALTASSKLHHLSLSRCYLASYAWRYALPPGKQLPQLTSLTLEYLKNPSGGPAVAPAGKLLVSCCPGLQHLELRELRKSATRAVLQPLSGLSGLQTLILSPAGGSQGEGWLELCKLTGLRKLYVENHLRLPRGLVLQLTQLQQLTSLYCRGHGKEVEIKNEVG